MLAIGDDGRPTQVEATVLIDVATRTIAASGSLFLYSFETPV
ncbi:hypothetical protein [Embleya sp. NBC_00896]|nr:hypothetical protein OG928_32540 [Embleya sp. NBC_00896]